MKKLFRFKYEPCNGTCYCHQPIFFSEMKKLNEQEKDDLIVKIVKAHDQLCDNSDYSFGLDLCEKTGIFIGYFNQPDRLDIFTGKTLKECISEVCTSVVNTKIPKKDGICVFGDNGSENLSQQLLDAVA